MKSGLTWQPVVVVVEKRMSSRFPQSGAVGPALIQVVGADKAAALRASRQECEDQEPCVTGCCIRNA
jgi:hypothetical protein